MPRTRYLVTYDVVDDKRRTKIHTLLKDFGDRLQYSVFRCDLGPRDLVQLRAVLHPHVHHEEDQVLIITLGPVDGPSAQQVESIGKPYRVGLRTRIV